MFFCTHTAVWTRDLFENWKAQTINSEVAVCELTSSQRSKRPPCSRLSGTLICHWKSNSFVILLNNDGSVVATSHCSQQVDKRLDFIVKISLEKTLISDQLTLAVPDTAMSVTPNVKQSCHEAVNDNKWC